MEDKHILEKIDLALAELLARDEFLLINDLSERSISHKLAEYLQTQFPDYHVDCEYNGSAANDYEKKKINIVWEQLAEAGLLHDREMELEGEVLIRSVFPDIIIHQRGSHDENLCIIEIKKSSSAVDHKYDHIKLQAYTSSNLDNVLKYQLGVFIEIAIGDNPDSSISMLFKNGIPVD
ncbi:hypothetical protein [Marinoscillum luteum]|uniref:Uncharacterized protein n=1 Tax=Marinoscillum luteum TaxID=861051 RepID=A0ABW7N7K7_9BACT